METKEKRLRHFPEFPSQFLDDEAKQKVLRIINAMHQSLYILPFLHMEKQKDKNQTTQSFAQILDNVKENNYLSTNNVLRDLYSASSRLMSSEEIQIDLKGNSDYNDLSILCSRSDLDHASERLIKILINKVSQEFPPKNPLVPLKPSSSLQIPSPKRLQGPLITESSASSSSR